MKGKNVSRLFNNVVPTEKVTWHHMRQESHYERRAYKDLNGCDHDLLKALSCYPMRAIKSSLQIHISNSMSGV
jgi:hypothetical protein